METSDKNKSEVFYRENQKTEPHLSHHLPVNAKDHFRFEKWPSIFLKIYTIQSHMWTWMQLCTPFCSCRIFNDHRSANRINLHTFIMFFLLMVINNSYNYILNKDKTLLSLFRTIFLITLFSQFLDKYPIPLPNGKKIKIFTFFPVSDFGIEIPYVCNDCL